MLHPVTTLLDHVIACMVGQESSVIEVYLLQEFMSATESTLCMHMHTSLIIIIVHATEKFNSVLMIKTYPCWFAPLQAVVMVLMATTATKIVSVERTGMYN